MGRLLPFNVQDYKLILTRQPERRADAVKLVMGCASYQEFKRYYEHTPRTFVGLFKKYSNYLKRESYCDIYGSGLFGIMKPLDYVGMLSYVLPLFKKEINEFVVLERKYEDLYLNGAYDEAERLIHLVNGKISYSLWAAINQIKISELKGGLDKRLETFNKLNGMKVQPMFQYLCDYAQETASINTSAVLFYEKRKAEIESFQFPLKWQTDYLLLHMFPYDDVELNECMSYDFKSSLIDVYLGFITYLPKLLITYQDHSLFRHYLSIIHDHIDDERLEKCCALAGITDGRQLTDASNNHEDIDNIFDECVNAVKEGKEIGDSEGTLHERIQYHLFYYLGNDDRKVHGNRLAMISLSNVELYPLRRLSELLQDLEESNFATFGSTSWMYSEG